jgi:hypothetical protein
MRFLPLVPLLFLGALLSSVVPASAQTAQQLYTEAQRAYLAGDQETAKEKFRMVLAVNPKHQPSINYLRLIATSEAQGGAQRSQEKALASVVIPEVRFRDTSLGSALAYLTQTIAKQTDGKTQANFVLQLPEGYETEKKLTLSLNNAPFTTVLKYVGQLAEVSFGIEQYAIVVKPTAGAAAPTAPTAPTAPNVPATGDETTAIQ